MREKNISVENLTQFVWTNSNGLVLTVG
jgi:hypothetical protein